MSGHQLPVRTSRSIASWPALFRELEAVGNRGFAIDGQEIRDDVCAIGMAVGQPPPLCPVSGIAIATPASRANEGYPRRLLPALADARDRLRAV